MLDVLCRKPPPARVDFSHQRSAPALPLGGEGRGEGGISCFVARFLQSMLDVSWLFVFHLFVLVLVLVISRHFIGCSMLVVECWMCSVENLLRLGSTSVINAPHPLSHSGERAGVRGASLALWQGFYRACWMFLGCSCSTFSFSSSFSSSSYRDTSLDVRCWLLNVGCFPL